EVVPQYNLELKALRNAMRDLAPRITEGRAKHKQKLAAALGEDRTRAHQAHLVELREKVESAHHRHQQLSDEFMKTDSAASDDKVTAEVQKQRDAIETTKVNIAAIDQRINEMGQEIERVRNSRQI